MITMSIKILGILRAYGWRYLLVRGGAESKPSSPNSRPFAARLGRRALHGQTGALAAIALTGLKTRHYNGERAPVPSLCVGTIDTLSAYI
jgi:hypothetical protein